jgi:hypothetical protein
MEDDEMVSKLGEAARMLGLKPETVLRWMRLKGNGAFRGGPGEDRAAEGDQAIVRENDLIFEEFGSRAALISASIRLGMPEGEFVKRIGQNKDYARDFMKFLDLLYELTPDRSLAGLLLELYGHEHPSGRVAALQGEPGQERPSPERTVPETPDKGEAP